MLNKFKLPDWFFFFLLIALTLAFLKLTILFMVDVFLAALLAQMFYSFYIYLVNKLKIEPALASLISIVIAIFIIVLPIIGIGYLISKEVANLYLIIKGQWPHIYSIISLEQSNNYSGKYPFIKDILDIVHKMELQKQVVGFFSNATTYALKFLQTIVIDFSLLLLHIIVTIFLMFFLLLDGKQLVNRIFYLAPLHKKDKQELFDEVIKIVDATIIGIVLIGIIEGVYGGILFAIFGIASPLFWGVIMMIASIIPILGIHSVIFPASLILVLTGNPFGFILMFGSHLGTTFTQHYLKPYLIGRKGGVHPAFILLSMLGGLAWFGLIGFLAGPIIAALFIAVWNQFGKHYKKELEEWNTKE